MKKATPFFKRAKGCRALSLQRAVEKPGRYLEYVQWETLEDHIVSSRGSRDFREFQKLIGHCFARPPEIEHVREVVHGF